MNSFEIHHCKSTLSSFTFQIIEYSENYYLILFQEVKNMSDIFQLSTNKT